MKLPNFLESSLLNDLRNKMRADRLGDISLTVDPNRLTEAELDRLVHGGLDVSSIDDVRVLPDGTLAYKDSRVLVYIRDVAIYKKYKGNGVWNLPRFHFANCETLQKMRQEKRFERYVVAARKDGLFEVNLIENEKNVRSSTERLRVCQNCLSALSYEGFSREMPSREREARVSAFRLDKFFSAYPRALLMGRPEQMSNFAPLNVYPDDFPELAAKIKAARGWRCEALGCGVVLSAPELRKYLHLHHVNGQKYDSRPENLSLRCISCHSDEPRHAHVKAMPDYLEFQRIRPRLLDEVRSIRAVAEPAEVLADTT